jgi:DNA-binding protein H-NS
LRLVYLGICPINHPASIPFCREGVALFLPSMPNARLPFAEQRIWSVLIIIRVGNMLSFNLVRSKDLWPWRSQLTSKSIGDATMKHLKLAVMSVDELWSLRDKTRSALLSKLDAKKHELERRLAQLNVRIQYRKKARRPYPSVHPKYRNPQCPSETWSGRGKQPLWVVAHLRSGKKVDDLLIARVN